VAFDVRTDTFPQDTFVFQCARRTVIATQPFEGWCKHAACVRLARIPGAQVLVIALNLPPAGAKAAARAFISFSASIFVVASFTNLAFVQADAI